MEETSSVFLVDLGYRLRSRNKVPPQGSRWVTDTPSCSCSCYACYTCSWLPYSWAWFSTRSLGHGPEYVRAHLKYGQCLQSISFNNLGPRLTRVIGVVWDASITGGN